MKYAVRFGQGAGGMLLSASPHASAAAFALGVARVGIRVTGSAVRVAAGYARLVQILREIDGERS